MTKLMREIGKTPPEFKYKFTIEAKGGKTLLMDNNQIIVDCKANIKIYESFKMIKLYQFEQTKDGYSELIFDEAMFTSQSPIDCPIKSFKFIDTSLTS